MSDITAQETPVVYCVVPVHNRRRMTARFIQLINGQTYPQLQLIVVDDGSTDGTSELLAQHAGNTLVVLKGDGSLWWGGAMRLGMKYVLSIANPDDFLLMINDDVYIEPEYVDHLVGESLLSERAVIGSLQCSDQVKHGIGSGYHINYWSMRVTPSTESSGSVDCLPGRGTLFPMEAVRRSGLVYAGIFPHYFGDIEYSARVKEKGWLLKVSQKARVFTSAESSDAHVKRKGFLHGYLTIRSKNSLVQWLMFYSVRGPWMSRLTALPRYVVFGLLRLLS